jgi:hypothetical protein
MTFAFTYEVPIGPDVYAEIKQGVGPHLPEGLISHVAYRTESGLRYVDVWRAKEDWNRFVDERLHPVVDKVLTEALGFRPPEPPMTVLDVVDVWVADRQPAAADR